MSVSRGFSRTRASHLGLAVAVLAVTFSMSAGGLVTADATGNHGKHRAPVRVVAEGLNGPRQVSSSRGHLLVAESDAGLITAVNPRTGTKSVMVRALSSPQGVVAHSGRLYIATGESAPDDAPSSAPASGLMVTRPGGTPRMFADLTAYELANNPDGQTQFGPDGQPLDTLSNPYFVIEDRSRHGFLLVADAGANAVLKVDHRGRISTFFVPPTVTTGICAAAENNTPSGVGCDSVPTGLAYGPDGLLYVSALTSEVEGEGRVYVVNNRGQVRQNDQGFTSPTGVAVDRRGNVYVSELLEGFPPPDAPPPPDFDPSSVGQIVMVPRWGQRQYAQVTMPSSLLWRDDKLYSSAWAVASFVGIPDAGQVVTVHSRAFHRSR